MIQSNFYDLILTDIKMPGFSGIEVLSEVRKNGHTIPMIGMSGTPWLLDETLFDAVLEKPCTQQDLFEKINTVIAPF